MIDHPPFLPTNVTPERFRRWLDRKAAALVRRDKKRDNTTATLKEYKQAIHEAVVRSGGLDAYTGEPLDWSLIGTYDNTQSKALRRAYKATLALLPTVDHVGDGLGPADFEICGWCTNDAKNDLTRIDFVALCRKVVAHADLVPSMSTSSG
jgi:hypothetical protein